MPDTTVNSKNMENLIFLQLMKYLNQKGIFGLSQNFFEAMKTLKASQGA